MKQEKEILAVIESWETQHIKPSNLAYDDEIGAHVAKSLVALKESASGGVSDAASFVTKWKVKHLHNSVLSRNTVLMNTMQPKLEALVTALNAVPDAKAKFQKE